jgi:hypothetical protein
LVYGWENRVVAPRDRTTIEFAAAQSMVDAIWSDMDLRYPPAVEQLSRQATATIASANRLSLSLPDRTPAGCLLHEIAHAMSMTDGGWRVFGRAWRPRRGVGFRGFHGRDYRVRGVTNPMIPATRYMAYITRDAFLRDDKIQ